ncbi:MAG: hypothetical protein ABIN18_26695 [Pseudomonadota bacterium]
MRKIIIREDALLAIRDKAIFPFQKQQEAGEIVAFGKKVKVFFIQIDADVESHIRSKGIDVDDVDQVSDFIVSALTPQH